jgi:hypothetical protein
MESTERAYYQALFRRDFGEAQRLYRELACTDVWSADRLVREGHKCGIYDEADRGDVVLVSAPTSVAAVDAPILVAFPDTTETVTVGVLAPGATASAVR